MWIVNNLQHIVAHGRFINHSDNPNVEVVDFEDKGADGESTVRLLFRTMKTIAQGEQLLLDYGSRSRGPPAAHRALSRTHDGRIRK